MLKKQRPKITLKGGVVICICTFLLCLIVAIALFATSNSNGGIICIIAGVIFLIPAIIYYVRFQKPKIDNEKRENALSNIVDALIKDLDIVCTDSARQKSKQDAIDYVYYLSDEEIEERSKNLLLFYNPIRNSMCCVESEQELLVLIHSILIFNYANFRPYIEQIRIDNDLPPIKWYDVKKSVFYLIRDHLNENTNKPMDFDDKELIEKIKTILVNNPKTEISHTPFHK